MTWGIVATVVSVAGTAYGAYEQHQVAKKQDNQLAAQLQQQKETEGKVAQRNAQLIHQQQGQTDQPQKTAAAKSYQEALAANQQQANAPLATVGNVSEAYKKSGSDAALGISGYGKQQGDLTAAIDAPGQQRRDNQRNINDYGIDVNQINRHQKGQDFLDSLKLNSIHANPYAGLLTSVAKAYAGSKAGSYSGGDSGGSGGYWGNSDVANGTLPASSLNGLGGSAQSPWLTKLYGTYNG